MVSFLYVEIEFLAALLATDCFYSGLQLNWIWHCQISPCLHSCYRNHCLASSHFYLLLADLWFCFHSLPFRPFAGRLQAYQIWLWLLLCPIIFHHYRWLFNRLLRFWRCRIRLYFICQLFFVPLTSYLSGFCWSFPQHRSLHCLSLLL